MRSLTSSFAVLCALGIAGAAAAQAPLTTNSGAPVGDNQNSKTAGENGPVLLEDIHLLEKLAHFDRERIPERVVHARGVGVYGEFESYDSFSKYTKAAFLSGKGKKTPTFVRFSTVIHPSGSPEIARDPRGFAVKFYTEQGNYDLVGNNLPVFFIRDAMKFPDMVHSLKPSPITNKQDPNRFFDFFSHQPESTHMLTLVYSDLGTPANYRQMDGNGVHAYKWVNGKGEVTYVKYHWKTQQGVKTLTAAETEKVVAKDWGNATTDLYQSIYAKRFPSWELSVQMLKPEDLDRFDFNPLDATKIWPEKLVPSVKVGKMTLNRMPDNFFEETEQAAFAPGNLVPGIEASEDRLLQGRLFSYLDTQRYRLGVNFQQLAVNRSGTKVSNHNQNGAMDTRRNTSDVNYQPSITDGKSYKEDSSFKASTNKLDGSTLQRAIKKQQLFRQAGDQYLAFTEAERTNLINNLVGDLSQVKNDEVKHRMVSHFYKANREYGTRLAEALKIPVAEIEAEAKRLPND